VLFREYSKLAEGNDTPYYPLRLEGDKAMLRAYMQAADSTQGVSFVGRLGTYRYLDMHVVIGESLDLAQLCLARSVDEWPKFAGSPL
jgi:UDP-galactopyranose mutase